MDNTFYTVEQISAMLDLHPKTVQRYIREGKLRAVKVGKGWRVTGHDLSVFTEHNGAADGEDGPHQASAVVSAVADITVTGHNEAIRIMNTLTAVLNAKPPEYGVSSMQTQHIAPEGKVRVTLWGTARFMAAMMDIISSLTDKNEME